MVEKIDYEIDEAGRCSYCGKEADLVEHPDGGLVWADNCANCDMLNAELTILEYLEFAPADNPETRSPARIVIEVRDEVLSVEIRPAPKTAGVVAAIYEVLTQKLIECGYMPPDELA